MTEQLSLDWTPAQRRDDGMRRAVEHADAVEASWSARAHALLLEYAVLHGEWMVEDLRDWTLVHGLPNPPDGRAWGAVVQRAARSGAIVRVGYAPAKSSNLSPKCLWVLAKEGA
jgi:hypothetical protein